MQIFFLKLYFATTSWTIDLILSKCAMHHLWSLTNKKTIKQFIILHVVLQLKVNVLAQIYVEVHNSSRPVLLKKKHKNVHIPSPHWFKQHVCY